MKSFQLIALVLMVQILWLPVHSMAQNKGDKELIFSLNESGTHYLKSTVTAQIWTRYNESNPGSKINGYAQDQTFDIGLRRVRSQIFGKIHDKVFFYSQIGLNNINSLSSRKQGLFLHDCVLEYQLTPKTLQIGAGLSSWNGLSRYSSLAIASILGMDGPLYQQTTNDVSDQFFRKFSIYAKGKLGKLDYRINLSNPMAVQNAAAGQVKAINPNSDFSYKPAKIQTSAYFMWQFLDQESNMLPFGVGSYLGKKRVFNIGAGYQYQAKAMWHYSDTAVLTRRTIEEDMLHLNVDVFYERPIGEKGAAFTAYAAFTKLGYGKNYLRNSAPMNPSDAGSSLSIGGGGNGVPLYGTGNVIYAQAAYLLPRDFLGSNHGQLQPYVMGMHANYDRLKDPMLIINGGINYLLDGNRSKISLDLQNRPVFNLNGESTDRKNAVVVQLQLAI